jgi:hypothetical protein
MEMASAYLKDQAERQQPIDAEWLHQQCNYFEERPVGGWFFKLDSWRIVVEDKGNDGWMVMLETDEEGVVLRFIRTRGQLLDLLAGLRGGNG